LIERLKRIAATRIAREEESRAHVSALIAR